MNKNKTLYDFFTKSPANKSSSRATEDKPKASEKEAESSKSSPILSRKNVFVQNDNKQSTKSSPSIRSPANRTSKKTNINAEKGHSFSPKLSDLKKKLPVKNDKRRASTGSDDDQSEMDEEAVKSPQAKSIKRKRIVIASESDESDEYDPGKCKKNSDSSDSCDSSESDTPKKKPKKHKKQSPALLACKYSKKAVDDRKESNSTIGKSPKTPSFSATPHCSPKISTPASKLKFKSNSNTPNEKKDSESDTCVKEYFHEKLDFLKDGNIRDKSGKLKSDPTYNSHTLHFPESFKKTLTPAMKQWWDMKSEHFDTILFFKVGKFYELYHMDAAIGVKELGLIYMKGDHAHSGFPEIAFGKYADSLIEKGYKVARVEQTETPQMMEERCKKLFRVTKYDKVVAREICQITTKGTKTLTYQNDSMGISSNFLLSICEKHIDGTENASEYGICFVDTSIGKFTLGEFSDDRHGSRLLTLIALHPPIEILYDKASVSKKTLKLLNNNLSGVSKEALSSNSQFWDSSKVLKFMSESGYFDGTENSLNYPEAIMKMLDRDDRLLQTPLKQYELAFRSLGACIWYLKECRIEDCLLTMKLFEEYIPLDQAKTVPCKDTKDFEKHMVLDGVTLQNLDIVPLLASDNTEGTLLGTMDYCSTSFGKRLFRNWLCSPPCNPEIINNRLDAIDDLLKVPEIVEKTVSLLKKLPDLERLLSKIHAYGLSRSQDHPESRAIFYESDIYNKRKICDFLSTLQGFKEAAEIASLFKSHSNSFKSSILRNCTSTAEQCGLFPEILQSLEYFDNAFDHEMAKKQGNIIPYPGVDKEFDSAKMEIAKILKDLDIYLSKQNKNFCCKVTYVGSGRNRYMLEIPESKKVPSGFEFQGGRKGFKRYYTKEIKEWLECLTNAEESRNSALRDVARRIFSHFDKDYEMWKTAIHCVSSLDVLISLVLYHNSSGINMCRPKFSLPDSDVEPHLEIIDGKHPTFLKYFTGDDYIPNSVYIGPKRENEAENMNNGGMLVLVTGPNMGGKSTLMRQAGTLVIMAQLGSFVPAESMCLTPVDRIFTRVGANDQISKGESTFFVEASETSSILHHATPNSFVLVDELGRGTSTHDGTAIACAALNYLANDVGCRTLFSTHYHSLVEDFCNHPSVGLGHMACMVEKDSNCPVLEKITFLYKFINGACPKSYGFNVALLAGISKDIVQQGFLKAQRLEYSTKISKLLKCLLTVKTPEEIIKELGRKLPKLF